MVERTLLELVLYTYKLSVFLRTKLFDDFLAIFQKIIERGRIIVGIGFTLRCTS